MAEYLASGAVSALELVRIADTVERGNGTSKDAARLRRVADDLSARPAGMFDFNRRTRQANVSAWCISAFGDDHAKSVEQRAIRLIEEAIEAGQACGCDPTMIHRLVDHIFAKPAGDLHQELGGVGVTLLALAEAARLDADQAEHAEYLRVVSLPLEHFAARNAAKNAAGFNVLEIASIANGGAA